MPITVVKTLELVLGKGQSLIKEARYSIGVLVKHLNEGWTVSGKKFEVYLWDPR